MIDAGYAALGAEVALHQIHIWCADALRLITNEQADFNSNPTHEEPPED